MFNMLYTFNTMSDPKKSSGKTVPGKKAKRFIGVRFDTEDVAKIERVAVRHFTPPNWSAAVRMLVKKAKA